MQTRELLTKDELNLAEFPFALLTDKPSPDIRELRFSDVVTRDGQEVERSWVVKGAEGIPTSSDEAVYLALMMVAKEQNFESNVVTFTAFDLLRRLGQKDDGRNYARLRASITRLAGVKITANHAFYSKGKPDSTTFVFGILDSAYIRFGVGSKDESYVRFSDELWASIVSGCIKTLDLGAYLSLSSSVARRLFRYLDKVRYGGRRKHSIGLRRLAHERLGMPRHYYPSTIRQQLAPAHQQLIDLGFLSTAEYREGKEDVVVEYRFRSKEPESPDLVKVLTERGVTAAVARSLVSTYDRHVIERQLRALSMLKRKPQNPGGWLRTAIEEQYKHEAPPEVVKVKPLTAEKEGTPSMTIDEVRRVLGEEAYQESWDRNEKAVRSMSIYRGRELPPNAIKLIEQRVCSENVETKV